MYDLIEAIFDHTWITTNSGAQQYIYYIGGALIIILCITFIDLIYRVFSHFWRGGK